MRIIGIASRCASPRLVLPASVLALATLAAPGAPAATSFRSEVSYGWTYNSSPGYTSAFDTPDRINEIEVVLPYKKDWQTGSWGITYRPTYRHHDKFKDLDRVDHLARIQVESHRNRKRTFFLDGYFADTQSQNVVNRYVEDSAPTFLTYRTDQTDVGLSVGTEIEGSRDWTWSVAFEGGVLEIDQIDDFDSGVPIEQTGTQVRYGARFGGKHDLTAKTAVGFRYRITRYDLDLSEDETVNDGRFTVDHVLSRSVTLSTGVGASHRSEGDEVDMVGDVGLVKTLRQGSVAFRLSRSAYNGGALAGGSVVDEARIRYSDEFGRNWNWYGSTSYAVRQVSDPMVSDIDRFRIGAGTGYRGSRLARGAFRGLGFNLEGSYVDQSGADDPNLNSSYYIVTTSIVAVLGTVN